MNTLAKTLESLEQSWQKNHTAATMVEPLPPEEFWKQAEAVSRQKRIQMAKERQRLRWQKMQEILDSHGVPRRYHHANFDNYEIYHDDQKLVVNKCCGYVSLFQKRECPARNLLLLGRPGTGKTHLACAIVKAVTNYGKSTLYLTESDLMRRWRASFDHNAQLKETDILKELTATDLLVIDEVGRIDFGTSERRQGVMFSVINARYNQMKPTIVSSNLNDEGLRRYLGEAAMERLIECVSVCIMDWPSYRTLN